MGIRSIAALGICWVVLCTPSQSAAQASDLAVRWDVPRDCPDRQQLQRGLEQRVGRALTFGDDATLGLTAKIRALAGGYELELSTRSAGRSEERTLRARSCSELVRASLLIAALLLGTHGDAPPLPAATATPESPRTFFVSVRARAVGDLGSLAAVSFGPGLGIGVGLAATHLELGAVWLPYQEIGRPQALGKLQLMAASVRGCQELVQAPMITFAPCLSLETGRTSGRGASSAWWTALLGVRLGWRLLDALYAYADIAAGLPFVRPRFAVRGQGIVDEVPAAIGRLELSLEGRL